jgi:hypothetical protein
MKAEIVRQSATMTAAIAIFAFNSKFAIVANAVFTSMLKSILSVAGYR